MCPLILLRTCPKGLEDVIIKHNYFRQTLIQAGLVVFIGFSFRDEYINEIIQTSLNDKAQVIILNPNPDIEIPLRKEIVHRVNSKFDVHSVTKVIDVINKYGLLV